MKPFETVQLLGLPFIQTTMVRFVDQLQRHVNEHEKAFVVTANPEIAMFAKKDESYGNLLREKATYITADGIGVVKAAKWTGNELPERVTGFDTFMLLLKSANEHKNAIYLVGAKDEVLQKAVKVIRETFPDIRIAGSHHGYFDLNDPAIKNDILKKEPDFIFAALGFPRQEQFIGTIYDELNKGICMGIGGSFDVLAGEVKRAPDFWQKLNLEWFYRMVKQPERFKRNMILPLFLFEVMKEKRNKKA